MTLFLSIIIGFIAASPIGPMGMLCLRRAFFHGFNSGIVSAMGVSSAYLFWAFVAIHGLSAFPHWVDQKQQPLEIAIGLFFFLYGLHAIFNSPTTNYPTIGKKGSAAEFFSTFLVVLLNPGTFVMFTALFTLLGIAKGRFGALDSLEIAFSVFGGAITFWIMASHAISHMRNKLKDVHFRKISRISAVAIMAFGIFALFYAM